MTAMRWSVLLTIGLVMLAGSLRLHRLGAWSFAGDELATFQEADSFTGRTDLPPGSQLYRLPRLIPVSYSVTQTGYDLFGRDEFGSRAMPALLGALGVGIVFLGLERLMGRPTALATALLVCLWPEHLFQSQQNRFYTCAALFGWGAMLLGAWAWQRQSIWLALLSGGAALLAVLSHSLLAILFPGLLAGFLLASRAEQRNIPWRLLLGVVLMGVLTAGVVLICVLRVGLGWNDGAGWGYSVGHALQAGVNRMGLPVTLLALLGGLGAVVRREGIAIYWVAWAGTWLIALVLFPLVLAYHPAYVFSLSLGVLVLAGLGLARIGEGLRSWSPAVAHAAVGAICALQVPGVLSHFSDGSRYDYRSAGQFLTQHWQQGDRVVAASDKTLSHYLASPVQPEAVRLTPERLDQVVEQGRGERVWIVVPSTRGGQPEELRRWLDRHCSRQTVLRRPRLDYFDFTLEIYLHERGSRVARP